VICRLARPVSVLTVRYRVWLGQAAAGSEAIRLLLNWELVTEPLRYDAFADVVQRSTGLAGGVGCCCPAVLKGERLPSGAGLRVGDAGQRSEAGVIVPGLTVIRDPHLDRSLFDDRGAEVAIVAPLLTR